MSKLNTSRRMFNTNFRRSTVIDPRVTAQNIRDRGLYLSNFVSVPAIVTRGTWPMVHMIDEDTFVQMAILAKHVAPNARKRYVGGRESKLRKLSYGGWL